MLAPRAHTALCLALALSAGCHAHHDDCYDCGPPVYFESEPNDSAFQPDLVGPIGPGDAVLIEGHIGNFGPDVYDGFAFTTTAPCDIEFALYIDEPFADLDVCIWDPQLGQFVACFESSANPETGVFSIAAGGKPFHLVVTSFSGSSTYGLDVRGYGLSFASSSAPLPESALILRPGGRERWDGYGAAPVAQVEPEPIAPRAVLVRIDPESGEVEQREVAVLGVALD